LSRSVILECTIVPFYFNKILLVFSILHSSNTFDISFFRPNAVKSAQKLSNSLISSSCNTFPNFLGVISCSVGESILKCAVAFSLFIFHFSFRLLLVIIFWQLLKLFYVTLKMEKILTAWCVKLVLSQWWFSF
jgi:hypothetical protein